jgi:hypothetical protein
MFKGRGGSVTVTRIAKQEYAERYAEMFSHMTDEELVDKAFCLGREVNHERHVRPHQRVELRGIKAQIQSRLRNKNKLH